MFAPVQEKKTYEDYAALEEGAPYQLIDGELITSPAPTFLHQWIVWRLGTALFTFVEEHNLGVVVGSPVDVRFSDTDTFQPDLIYIANDRRHIVTPNTIQGAPDLVVEVLSPATGYYDLTHKKRVYEGAGVKEYWIVDPQGQGIEVFAHRTGAFERTAHAHRQGPVSSHLLEGFEIDLERLFS